MDVIECFLNISRSLDFTQTGLLQHHKRTAIIAAKIGKNMGLSENKLLELFQASSIHDLGLLDWNERQTLLSFEIEKPWYHCRRGYLLLNNNKSFTHLAKIIFSHHDRWLGDNPSGLNKNRIPLTSRIIHLADRVDILTYKHEPILENTEVILNDIKKMSGILFDPDLVSVLEQVTRVDSFWFDLISPLRNECLHDLLPFPHEDYGLNYLLDIAKLFAQVVDTKSPFTFRHSNGVAAISKFLGKELGLSPEICAQLEIAGLLHDLGKMSLPLELLEKPGKLNELEYKIIKQHAYYSYWLLKPVTNIFPLAEWASYHHERLNGLGYPFGKSAQDLDIEARLVAVSDVFVALKEDRPYRPNMKWEQIFHILKNMVAEGHLDDTAVMAVLDNKERLEHIWGELGYLAIEQDQMI